MIIILMSLNNLLKRDSILEKKGLNFACRYNQLIMGLKQRQFNLSRHMQRAFVGYGNTIRLPYDMWVPLQSCKLQPIM